MSTCPACRKPLSGGTTACPSCGRKIDPSDAWDDGEDALGGGLELSRGGSLASHDPGRSAYAGGGLSLGDDDDPFADDVPQASLELDVPTEHKASSARSIPVDARATSGAPPSAGAGAPPGAGLPATPVAVPDLVLPVPSGAPPARPAPPPARPAPPPDPGPPSSGRAPVPMAAPASQARPAGSDPSLPPGQHAAAPPPSQPEPQPPQPPPPPPPPDPAAIIARYPAPPDKVWEMPGYALRVLWRQLELRMDLESLRKRRSPDVPLYERALRAHDAKTFAVGLAITCAAFVLVSFLVSLPVLLRFLRDPD